MDFSQLPKMSSTPKPAQPSPESSPQGDPPRDVPQHAVPVEYGVYDGAFGLASVWISLILGLILMMLGASFGRWAIVTLSGREFQTGVQWTSAAGDRAGKNVAYFDLQGGTAWSDAGLFLMGVALLLDALLMCLYYRRSRPSRALVLFAIFFTGLAMLLNAGVGFYLFSIGVMPLLTMGALLVGGMMLFDHVPMAKSPNATR